MNQRFSLFLSFSFPHLRFFMEIWILSCHFFQLCKWQMLPAVRGVVVLCGQRSHIWGQNEFWLHRPTWLVLTWLPHSDHPPSFFPPSHFLPFCSGGIVSFSPQIIPVSFSMSQCQTFCFLHFLPGRTCVAPNVCSADGLMIAPWRPPLTWGQCNISNRYNGAAKKWQ